MPAPRERPRSRFAFDRSALFYAIVTLLLGVGSLHSQNNLLFIAFGVAVGVLLINGSYAQASLSRVRVDRRVPALGEVGRPLVIRYHLTSRSRWIPAGAVLLEEVRPRLGASPGRVSWAEGTAAAAATVRRDVPADVACELVPKRRGWLEFDGLDVSSRFPFGAVKKSLRFHQPDRTLVRPAKTMPSEEMFRTVAVGTRTSDHSIPKPGLGDEYLGLREYAPGDESRRIAWRASARHGRWVVRENATPASSSARLLLRLRRDLPEAANEEAVSLAAGTLALASRRGVRLGLCHPSGDGRVIHRLAAALDALALLDTASASEADDPQAALIIEPTAAGPRLRARRALAGAGA